MPVRWPNLKSLTSSPIREVDLRLTQVDLDLTNVDFCGKLETSSKPLVTITTATPTTNQHLPTELSR